MSENPGDCVDAVDPAADVCALPGCRHTTYTSGAPCACCVADFGPMLRESPRIAEPTPPPSEPERTTPEKDAQKPASDREAKRAKPGQICWLCEQRRLCTPEERGWECVDCRKIA